ncbi:formate dehydrogenase accessory sulfurtransferase FdhD [Xanthomonas cassavae CFBP 4642]|uniref:Sulfur carrier protein FdhD n=1 Tax=Xanthomonas cassavae CFBP 4642 TaxID=1219375 RepID=A0ABS8H9K3_9XANT|nr:formate dehydrogenase accessory sulfurtransferase FdhD [Xanthomonas cassavae]MCC4618758.1 formate dehydrogenase accessory sulfurtransferase FdhD [Xanthomonas cassavae CFBP 4642]
MTTPSSRSVRPGSVVRTVFRHRGGRGATVQDQVAAEMPVALIYNQVPFAVMMATPEDLEDFALGFSLSEGIIDRPQDLRVVAVETFLEGASLQIEIPPERAAALDQRRRNLDGRSGCGVCGNESIEAVLRVPPVVHSELRIETDALARALAGLHAQQPIAAQTGAVHAAGWADAEGGVRLVREDVGRHNALDKLIGALAHARIDASQGFAVVTSRASYEMAMKAAQARIPLLAAISAPTALAIGLADSTGLTLIGFARDHDCVVYSHPQRLNLGVAVGEPA